MKFYKLIIFYGIFCFFIFQSSTVLALASNGQHIITGKTMGTFYTIKFISPKKESLSLWKDKVEMRLKEVNQRLSMYETKSELSLFNRHEIGKPMKISSDFFAVLSTAKDLYQMTDGAWDGTMKPLIDLWGFGTKKATNRVPAPDTIALALAKTGFNFIDINGPRSILKRQAVTLDLGSIAKGYGVDTIATLFTSSGIHDVLVEIGGEIYASGKNKKKTPGQWASAGRTNNMPTKPCIKSSA